MPKRGWGQFVTVFSKVSHVHMPGLPELAQQLQQDMERVESGMPPQEWSSYKKKHPHPFKYGIGGGE